MEKPLYVPLPATIEEARAWLLILDGINESAAEVTNAPLERRDDASVISTRYA